MLNITLAVICVVVFVINGCLMSAFEHWAMLHPVTGWGASLMQGFVHSGVMTAVVVNAIFVYYTICYERKKKKEKDSR